MTCWRLPRLWRRSVGEIISELARNSLRQSNGGESGGERNGIPLLPSRAKASVTLEIVNSLRDEASWLFEALAHI
jgi:hypothetical protein